MDQKIVFTPFEVIHDKMGNGTAIGYCVREENTFLKVRFSNGENREFVFPDQFVLHLKATEPEVQNQIKEIIKRHRNPINNQFVLRQGIGPWRRAIDVYDFGCRRFDWDPKKRVHFDRQRILYAADATPEGYAVWCLPHHDWKEPYNEDQNWYNYISESYIEEVWFADKPNFYSDDSVRVTFIKTKDNFYEMFGIFRPVRYETKEINGIWRKVKIYQKIADEYPI